MDIYSKEYDLAFIGDTESDLYVFNEIYGDGDAYQRDRLLKYIDGGEVIEVGGHKGFFSALAGKFAKKVVAFEPNELNFEYLMRNLELNKMRHVMPVRKAVAMDDEPRLFTVSNKTDARHSLFATDFNGIGEQKQFVCTTIVNCILDYSIRNISLLKLDCEGGEYEILFNLDRTIFDHIPRVVCEIHEAPEIPYKLPQLVEHMNKMGFSSEIYSARTMETMNLYMAWFSK